MTEHLELESTTRLLCLKCRSSGHCARDCSAQNWLASEFDWFSSQARYEYSATYDNASTQEVCDRCQKLDLPTFLAQQLPYPDRTWQDERLLSHDSKHCRKLGRADQVVFYNDCGVCRCLFGICPNPVDKHQELVIVPSATIYRLEGLIKINTDERRSIANAISITLIPSDQSDYSTSDGVGDALCLLEDDARACGFHLGGRRVNPKQIDYSMIHRWVSTCLAKHPVSCANAQPQELQQITLIDTHLRQVVPYPGPLCEYLALSYVWGGCDQQKAMDGNSLAEVPQTIEDAITLVQGLGKRYLWVDSCCIRQTNEAEKLRHIAFMHLIYSAAWATIVAISGSSADEGLPRFSSPQGFCPQLSCSIDGKRLVGTMMNLSSTMHSRRWGRRAWTLQEGLLSSRCIYVGDQQIYFECNSMQACESLDDSLSWAHNNLRDYEFFRHHYDEDAVGAGVMRCPGRPMNDLRMVQYTTWMRLYSFRSMKYTRDTLNALSGILQQFRENGYSRGFFQGLPVEDLNWALCWTGDHSTFQRRRGFASWSWAGWEGVISMTLPADPSAPHKDPVSLRISKLEQRRLVCLFEQDAKTGLTISANSVDAGATQERLSTLEGSALKSIRFSTGEEGRCLIITSISIRLRSRSLEWRQDSCFQVRGKSCYLSFDTCSSMEPQAALRLLDTRNRFRLPLLARSRYYLSGVPWVCLYFMLLVGKTGTCEVFEREGIVNLFMPETELDVLSELHPRYRTFAVI